MHWWDEEYEFEDIAESIDDDPEPEGIDVRDLGLLESEEDSPESEQVFVGTYFSASNAERVEDMLWKIHVIRTTFRATFNTFKAQWRMMSNGGHKDVELIESSKRALARLTLAASANTHQEKVAAYAMIREEEEDYLLAAASTLQAAASALNIVRKKYGQEAVDEVLARCGMALLNLDEQS